MQNANNDVEFHAGFLCSADSLATNCGPTKQTTCLPGKDGVYFIDSCGNPANIYDASKIKDPNYWTYIKDINESCNPDSADGNAGSSTCGNCNGYAGGLCRAYERGNSKLTEPDYGNYVCADLSCTYSGKDYHNGESFCVDAGDAGTVGSESYVLICNNGKLVSEQCAAERGQVCVQDNLNGASTASCRFNRWQDCTAQDNKIDCEDQEERDCKWTTGQTLSLEQFTNETTDDNGISFLKYFVLDNDSIVPKEQAVQDAIKQYGIYGSSRANITGAACVPAYPKGFDFWNQDRDTIEAQCRPASVSCIVRYDKSITTLFGWSCKENCYCLEDDQKTINKDWKTAVTANCNALGDCGIGKNYIGKSGALTEDDVFNVQEISQSS